MESSTLPDTPSFAAELRRHQDQQPENPWLGLHPASLFINLLPQTFLTLRGVWPILLVFLFADQGSGTEFFDLTLILSFFALARIDLQEFALQLAKDEKNSRPCMSSDLCDLPGYRMRFGFHSVGASPAIRLSRAFCVG